MRTIRFKRERPDGTLQPMVLTLDDRDVFVSEHAETPEQALVATHPHLQDMMMHGVKFEQQGNSIMIKEIPASEHEVIRFFTFSRPCWFGGCEELRSKYAEAKAARTCLKCEGALTREFMPLVREALKKHYATQDQHTGTGPTS